MPSWRRGTLSVDGLTRRDREILAFERQWWKYAGAKEQAIRELFDMSTTRYYQVLNALIDNPAALVADPMLVRRLSPSAREPPSRQRSARRSRHRGLTRHSWAGSLPWPAPASPAIRQERLAGIALTRARRRRPRRRDRYALQPPQQQR